MTTTGRRAADSTCTTELETLLTRREVALETISHGLLMIDGQHRIVLFNQRFLELYNLPSDAVRQGTTLRQLYAHVCQHNDLGVTADQAMRRLERRMAPREAFVGQLQMPGGRTLHFQLRPMTDGGWIGVYEDVTEWLRMEGELRLQVERMDRAFKSMSCGLSMYDADQRLVMCNDQYLGMYNLDPAVVKPGITHRASLAHSLTRGNHPGMSLDEIYAQRRAAIQSRRPVNSQFIFGDGREIATTTCPTSDGGWVAHHEDVTVRERAARDLREQNLRFDAAINNMSQGLCMFDADNRLIVCNEKYLTIFNCTPDVLKPGITLREVFEHGVARGTYSGASPDELLARRLAALGKKRPIAYDQELADGRTIAISINPMADGGWVGTFEDISERRKVESERAAALEELSEQYRRFDAALNNMPHGLCMLDQDRKLIVCNPRFLEMFGLSADVIKPGASVREMFEHSVVCGNYPAKDADRHVRDYIAQIKAGADRILQHLADGRVILSTVRPMPHGGWISIYEDVTERHRVEQSIAHMARHDPLTGLPNRLLFHEKMAEGLARVAARGEHLAVFCLDLDNFKTINDTLGHPIGDRLLQIVAERLARAAGKDDTIARLGGDEFAILQHAAPPCAAAALASRLVEIMAEPIAIDAHEINTGISIGVAIAPDDGTAADRLMKCADLALYRAKAEGRGTFRLFEQDMDARIQARRALELDLRRALGAGEFRLVYQPQINLASRELVGMEALLRWDHPARGPVPPSEFIPIAEEIGLIIALGEWVLRQACAEAARWPDSIKVAVNLSPIQFRNRNLVAVVTHALAAAGLAPTRLELEITEAVLLQEDEAIVGMLHQMRALGVRISMDDFGTGYSSLSYLRSFPFDKIKIDRSFIADLGRSHDSAAIVRAIAGLGASLGIETTAEGIETAEQLELVRHAGCTELQGYLVSPPRPASEVFDLIARLRRDVAAA